MAGEGVSNKVDGEGRRKWRPPPPLPPLLRRRVGPPPGSSSVDPIVVPPPVWYEHLLHEPNEQPFKDLRSQPTVSR